jgi:hypothetical protein
MFGKIVHFTLLYKKVFFDENVKKALWNKNFEKSKSVTVGYLGIML